jgi:succinoglycan biosynthesis protein ExoV
MKLGYVDVPNFGDALNPYIFNHYLPGFFDGQPDEVMMGIGSILGFEQFEEVPKKIVFSSGYAAGYATPPTIDDTYDVFCVRGPLTARELGLNADLAVTDGAGLLRFMDHEPVEKTHPYTYIPHKSTEKLYDWPRVCRETGIHYVSPESGVEHVLEEIRRSEVVLAEAMHAAIVADTFRIPWVPVVTNARINEFKWRDWAASLEMEYAPQRIPSIYQKPHIETGIRHRLGGVLPEMGIRAVAGAVDLWYRTAAQDKVFSAFEELKQTEPCLSTREVFDEKTSALRETLDRLRAEYHQA